MINSISLESNRFEPMLSYLDNIECRVIGLCVNDSGIPKSVEDVIDRAGNLIEGLEKIGLERDHIFIDPVIQPISTDITKGLMAMKSVSGIVRHYPGVHTICGLSNVSFGLPKRKVINRNFITLMMRAGLDCAILDPLDNKMMTIVKTSRMLLGKDNYCMDYIHAVKAGQIIL